jgi:phosphate transport system permease protein
VALAGAISYAAGGPGRAPYRTLIDVGVAVPHLLWGLGGAALLGEGLGLGYSAATGVVTLAGLLTPILVGGFLDGLTRAGAGVLPAARALGLPEWRIWAWYVLPRARPALLAACLLASGRACGDAAALYFTAGLGMRLLTGWDQSASTLAVHVLKLAADVAGGQDAAFAAAFVLLCLTALIQLPLLILSANPKGADHAS